MIIGPKITSKTYVLKTAKSMKYVLFRRAWVGFLALCLVLSPIAGILWNPQHNIAHADTAVYGFAKQMGGTGSDGAREMYVDNSGNIYTIGNFNGTADFDPGAGTSNLVSAGSTDIFISKLDSDGDFVWAKSFSSSSLYESGNSISVDDDGNVYLTGAFGGTADFDPGAGTANITASGSSDVFVAKLDTDGNYVWAKSFGGLISEEGNALALDDDANVYTTGYFAFEVDFDPGVGTYTLTSDSFSNDIFISKLDTDGNFVWAKKMGSSVSSEYGTDIVIDSSNDVITSGTFRGTVDFDPGAGTANLVSGGGATVNNGFISKLDTDGNYVWAKSFSSTSYGYANGIDFDSAGNIYTVGNFDGTTDFDPGAGTSNLVYTSGRLYISILDSSGDYISATNFGAGANAVSLSEITIDSDNNAYLTGAYQGTADFDPGAGTTSLASGGGTYDIFVVKYDSDLNLSWVQSFGSTAGNEYGGYGIALDSSNNIYTTGAFTNTVDFDPESGTSNLVSAGSDDVYISKLSPQGDPTVTASSPSLITTSSATLNGNITDLGGPENSATRGFEYGLTDSYGTTVTQSEGSYSTGAFTAEITGLACGTNYYFRAFATNSSGTGYSAGTSFPTSSCSATGTNTKSVTPTNPTPNIDLLSPITPVTPETPNLVNNPSNPTNRVGLPLLPPTERFLRNLGFGSTGEDVKRLQQFLNTNDYVVSTLGAGSTNQETNFFGPRTKQAVKVFQEHFSAQILAPLSLSSGTGYFGDSTRAFVNSLLK